MAARLFAILARRKPYAVVFRRGPSKLVRLIAWHTDTDRFEYGQWFKGRLYERRCDLSPSGSHLIYFAADFKQPYYSWTAISKPPYLTALALWPKGDCWHGGGLFEMAWSIWLNHRPPAKLVDGFNLKRDTIVTLNARAHGEDDPVYHRRLARDGWMLIQDGVWSNRGASWEKSNPSVRFDPPEIWERRSPGRRLALSLRMVTHGRFSHGAEVTENYLVSYDVITNEGQALSLGRCDWADWDRDGDLLFARQGKLFRLRPRQDSDGRGTIDLHDARELADFNDQQFEPIPPSRDALTW